MQVKVDKWEKQLETDIYAEPPGDLDQTLLVPGYLIAATAFVQNPIGYKGWPPAVPGDYIIKVALNKNGMVGVAVAKSITQVSYKAAAKAAAMLSYVY